MDNIDFDQDDELTEEEAADCEKLGKRADMIHGLIDHVADESDCYACSMEISQMACMQVAVDVEFLMQEMEVSPEEYSEVMGAMWETLARKVKEIKQKN